MPKVNSGSIAVKPNWKELVAPYRQPTLARSLWQLANTIIPFFALCYLMFLSFGYSYWLTLALAPIAAGFHLRIFIIFHDCGHGSYFKSAKANAIVGFFCGFLCFTPYYHWRHFHAVHHATVGNLDRRIDGELMPITIKKYTQNNGDVLTLTTKEYAQLSAQEKLFYRVYRNPLLLFVIMPLILFLVVHRFSNPRAAKREKMSVFWVNIAWLITLVALTFTIGLVPFMLIMLPVMLISATIGVWLFYIQHQYEETYWQPMKRWDFATAALKGSSFYKLPKLLHFFTGNIGYHHIHHLNPRIPNYNLEKCHKSNPVFQDVVSITIGQSFKSITLRLWDEEQQKMVSYKPRPAKVVTKTVKDKLPEVKKEEVLV
jgi:omega-6 fatty acid desaturase (delta-12 desaturase)